MSVAPINQGVFELEKLPAELQSVVVSAFDVFSYHQFKRTNQKMAHQFPLTLIDNASNRAQIDEAVTDSLIGRLLLSKKFKPENTDVSADDRLKVKQQIAVAFADPRMKTQSLFLTIFYYKHLKQNKDLKQNRLEAFSKIYKIFMEISTPTSAESSQAMSNFLNPQKPTPPPLIISLDTEVQYDQSVQYLSAPCKKLIM